MKVSAAKNDATNKRNEPKLAAKAAKETDFTRLPLVQKSLDRVTMISKVRHGAILKGVNKKGCWEVCKVVHSPVSAEVVGSTSPREALKWEYLGYEQCAHRNIFKPNKYVEEGDYAYLFSDMYDMDLYDLQDQSRSLHAGSSKHLCKSIVDAVHYLHVEKKICHMDIKPENVFIKKSPDTRASDIAKPENIAKSDVVLADMGFWTQCRDERGNVRRLKGKCGTHCYAAPEIVTIGYDGAKADIWSLGRTLFVLCIGFPPWEDAQASDAYYTTWMRGDHKTFWKAITTHCTSWVVPPSFMELMTFMLHPDPEVRFTIEQVRNHKFFSSKPVSFSPTKTQWKTSNKNPSH